MNAVAQRGRIVLVQKTGTSKDLKWMGHIVDLDAGRVYPEQSLHSAINHLGGGWDKVDPTDGGLAEKLANKYKPVWSWKRANAVS